jgi:Ca-activated chloride channel family protein
MEVVAVATPEQVDDARDLSVLASATSVIASTREAEAATAYEHGDRSLALELNAQNQAELDRLRRAAPAPLAAQLAAQKKAYEGHQGIFAAPPSSPAAGAASARDIGAREERNSDRATY